jgi:NitT/TauT family transport system substrate-binding protein
MRWLASCEVIRTAVLWGGIAAAVVVQALPALAQKAVSMVYSTTDQDVSYQPYGAYAAQAGWYKDMGLDVSIQTAATSSQVLQLLLSGQAQIGMVSPDALFLAAQSGPLPVKLFYVLIRKTIFSAIVRDDSPVKSFADLKGKIVSFPTINPGLSAYANSRYVEAGFTDADTKIVETGYGVTSMEALKNGSIDAFIGWPGLFASYKNAGYKFRVLPEASWQNDYYGIGLAATTDYIKNNPDVIAKISKGVAETAVLLKSDPDKVIREFWKTHPARAPLPGEDETAAMNKERNILAATLAEMRIDEFPIDFAWGSQDLATWQRHLKLLMAHKLVAKPLDPSDYFTSEFTTQANDFDHAAIK